MKIPEILNSIKEKIKTLLDSGKNIFIKPFNKVSQSIQNIPPKQISSLPLKKIIIIAATSFGAVMIFLIILSIASRPPHIKISSESTVVSEKEVIQKLILPGPDEWPFPLALEQKSRYTDSEAAQLMPDLGQVDISDLTRNRKAGIESLLNAID